MSLLARAVRRPVQLRPQPLKTYIVSRRYLSSDTLISTPWHEVIVLPMATVLDTVHVYSGLPWYASLPLSAILFRTCLVYPIFQRRARMAQIRRAQIQPLVEARVSYRMRDSSQVDRPNTKLNKFLATIQSRASIEKHLFRTTFANLTLLKSGSFLFLLVVSDALRKMMGAKEGLLSLLLGSSKQSLPGTEGSQVAQTQVSFDPPAAEESSLISSQSGHPTFSDNRLAVPKSPSDQGDMLAAASDQATASASLPDTEAASLVEAAASRLNVHDFWFDPTFLTEGLPWCPDLTAADPTLFLPFMFSGTFFATIYFAPRMAGVQAMENGKRPPPTNLQRIFMTFAMLSIVPALHMPVGLLLYFLSNLVVGQLQSRWLAYRYPIRPAPRACKQPVRVSDTDEGA